MKKKPLIAVTAISGIFPGAADIELFWSNIKNGVNQSRETKDGRWISPALDMHDAAAAPDKTYSTHACLLDETAFDPGAYMLDSDLTAVLDPLHHLVLSAGHKAYQACQTAHMDKRRMGAILASIALPTDASSRLTESIMGRLVESKLFPEANTSQIKKPSPAALGSARVTGIASALLCAELGLGKGGFTLDAACASSIYAVKLACDELMANRADMMLTGGVSRPDCLYTQVGFSQLGALSPTGVCAPFDKRGNGLVVGEGVGIIALKRLDDAIRDKDKIWAVIKGIGLSNDMRGNLLAPEVAGQIRAMKKAYAASSWSPKDVDYIECHGTGTPAGDRAELESLLSLWGDDGWSKGQCAIGSVKSMIGHLLTAAGAAGMIKTLLAMDNKILPPSINFKAPSENSPLPHSPFRVQTRVQKWEKRSPSIPRRAAVSAFGFGGINGHILFEEWNGPPDKTNLPKTAHAKTSMHPVAPSEAVVTAKLKSRDKGVDIAIVGMDVILGQCTGLQAFKHAVLNGISAMGPRPAARWRGMGENLHDCLENPHLHGGFIDDLLVQIGEFQIPPNEIPDILPQQLLALKVGKGAMMDASMPLRKDREGMGCVFGINFDFQATDFHLRWYLYAALKQWNIQYGLGLDNDRFYEVLGILREQVGHALTPSRVMGALGGIVASRVAREFKFGAQSFVVSNEEASGIRALEIAVRSLEQHETDTMLVGAVDLCGDIRSILSMNDVLPFSRTNQVKPFDKEADGTLPAEGAVALVLKRKDQAIEDKDRIYAIVKGMGSAGGGSIGHKEFKNGTYSRSLDECFSDAGTRLDSISYIETHGSGVLLQDKTEADALCEFFKSSENHGSVNSIAIGSLKPVTGYCGAVSGLASVVKTSLCLYHEMIPPLVNYKKPIKNTWKTQTFHMPAKAQFWLRNRDQGPRTAVSSTITIDGDCSHVMLAGHEHPSTRSIHIVQDKKRPLGYRDSGLFAVYGRDKDALTASLGRLRQFAEKACSEQTLVEEAARVWHLQGDLPENKNVAAALVLKDMTSFEDLVDSAVKTVQSDSQGSITGSGQIFYTPTPLLASHKIAFVYPGSGNHFLGMGQGIGTDFPDIFSDMDRDTGKLLTQLRPLSNMPWRHDWDKSWEIKAYQTMEKDPLNMIFSQVVYGSIMTRLVKKFGIRPDAAIGYSLGESASLFALGVWPDRGEMLSRMKNTSLFSTDLAGPFDSARLAWQVPESQEINWRTAVVNRSAKKVRDAVSAFPHVRLLIVNTDHECVIGGLKDQVSAVIQRLECQAFYLEGVVSVHCDAAKPVAKEYRDLHLFPVSDKKEITFYSCAAGKSYTPTRESAADAILDQALNGFNFTKTIHQAYDDGVMIFLEMGPRSSCTRMIKSILKGKPHLAVSAGSKKEEHLSLLNFLGTLIAGGIEVDLEYLYGKTAFPRETPDIQSKPGTPQVVVKPGSGILEPELPVITEKFQKSATQKEDADTVHPEPPKKDRNHRQAKQEKPKDQLGIEKHDVTDAPYLSIIEKAKENIDATTRAHEMFIDFSKMMTNAIQDTFDIQNELLKQGALPRDNAPASMAPESIEDALNDHADRAPAPVVFDRKMCMEFAVGSVGKMLGPEFEPVDSHKVRVRLPDEPLMLVDRIIEVQGEKLSLSKGKVVTEHDVLPDAWYLDGNRAPVCISVEAGQADLFLCSYLGIDHQVKGERAYRLLDAEITFHRGLPQPGDTIQYHINIDRFVRQGETWMFFFRFEGYIGSQHLITMKNGCAGFFTEDEVLNSGGIILTESEQGKDRGRLPLDWKYPVKMAVESYSDLQLKALRDGKPEFCFGETFKDVVLSPSICLPKGRMHLIDRILALDPDGGRFGMGKIIAEADIHPDAWFLTCHFVDDKVMPGTLMYECCAHTLRVFLLRMGWVTHRNDVCHEPVQGIATRLKCRGPVTQNTQKVHYRIEIKEMGYNPAPYVIADAHMDADGRHIVFFENMSMQMTGVTASEINDFWAHRIPSGLKVPAEAGASREKEDVLYDKQSIIAFATGKPSDAFGEPYLVFDNDRKIARLPGPPYCFMDRVTKIEPEPFDLKPGGWVEARYEMPVDAWYFAADRSGVMPFCVLLEVALQPCGWLAAYLGSALKSKTDLKFRNLGGTGVIHRHLSPDDKTLTMQTRMTKVSEAGEMIIEHFDFNVLDKDGPIYTGNTYFGFFTADALSRQKGITASELDFFTLDKKHETAYDPIPLPASFPFTPDDAQQTHTRLPMGLELPSKALLMVDQIDFYDPNGGSKGLGFIKGSKKVDLDEWFFKAHFYQDPVCPGSLGVESFIQIVKYMAMKKWPDLVAGHGFRMTTGKQHQWSYRGQIIPKNINVEIEADLVEIKGLPEPEIHANGILKVDGIVIYKMVDFGIRITPL